MSKTDDLDRRILALLRDDARLPVASLAATLGISPYTVAEHLDRACAKVGVRGRKALVAKLFLDRLDVAASA